MLNAAHPSKRLRTLSGIILHILMVLGIASVASAGTLTESFENPSSFNPVGAGTRAMSMGGANIALADNTTAASWNPAALGQLEDVKWQFAYVLSGYDRKEETHNELVGTEASDITATEYKINYLSVFRKFRLFDTRRFVCVSINYQHMFSLDRRMSIKQDFTDYTDHLSYIQEGDIYALGTAFSIRITDPLSFGLTINYWGPVFGSNEWTQEYRLTTTHPAIGTLTTDKYDNYGFDGVNFVLGLHWKITRFFSLGTIIKTPFSADIKHTWNMADEGIVVASGSVKNEMKMPLSYGVGIAYQPDQKWRFTADIYRIHWDQFEFINTDGSSYSPISGKLLAETDLDNVVSIRFGCEYERTPNANTSLIGRGGVFYDPIPSDDGHDDVYGISAGLGLVYGGFVFDLGYQYRFGSGITGNLVPVGSLDMSEHTIYTSMKYRIKR